MSESSKEEWKATNLSKERGREISFTLSAAQRLPFFLIFFVSAKFERNFLSSVEMQCNTNKTNFAARFNEQIPVLTDK